MAVKKDSKTPREQFTPELVQVEKDQQTDFFMKNAHFNKSKTYLKGKEEKQIDEMAYRKIHVGGVQMQIQKDVCITVDQLLRFDKKAKAYWLTERKGAAIKKDTE